jgi:hypothetical protein
VLEALQTHENEVAPIENDGDLNADRG